MARRNISRDSLRALAPVIVPLVTKVAVPIVLESLKRRKFDTEGFLEDAKESLGKGLKKSRLDLDVDTLRALEEALLDFGGCAVVISHDRWFLDRIATHILAFEGESQTVWFEGNYQEYEADRKRRLGIEADQPHRIKYKRLAVG